MNNGKLENYKETLKLNSIQREILIGTLLGDASMPKKNKNKLGFFNPYVKFEQKIALVEYVEHLYSVFSEWVGTKPAIRNIDLGKLTFRQSVWFKTYSHPSFLFYYQQFYGSFNEKKTIPLSFIKSLTPRSLAYWYMDDGSFNRRDGTCSLHTQGFGYSELNDTMIILAAKYNLLLSLHKDGNKWKLYVKRESTDVFLTLIKPYILPCFYYKINIS
jgi:hypothetical protein